MWHMNPLLSLIHIKPDLHTNEEGVNFSRAHPSFVGKVGEGGGGGEGGVILKP